MSQYEKLGVELVIINDKLEAQLKEIAGKLNSSLKLDGLDKVIKSLEGVAKAGTEAKSSLTSIEKEVAGKISKVLDKDLSDAEKILRENKVNKALRANMQEYGRIQTEAYQKSQSGFTAMIAKEKQLLAELQQARNKANADSSLGRVQGLSRQGFQLLPDQASWVKKTAVTDINAAYSEALKINQAYDQLLPKIREYEQYLASLRTRGQAIWNGQVVSVQEYGRKLREMNGEMKQTNILANLLGPALGRMATRLAEFYSIRSVLFAVSGQVRESIASTLDLSQSAYDIAAISGAATDNLNLFSGSIMDIAKNSRFTTQEVSELMKVLAQAGVAAEALPTVSRQVGIFATATASDPKIAADLTTTALNVFNLKAEQTARVTNAMTAALNESKLSADGLATAFNYLAPQAAQFGMSLEQTLGMIATQAQAGIKPSTIGTGLSQLLKELAAPKPRLNNLLKNYGIDPDDINPKLKSLADIADTFRDKGVQAEHVFQSLESRVGRSLITAMTLGGDSFRLMTDNVTGTSAAMVAFEKTMDGPRARINVLKQEFTEAIKAISEGITGDLISAGLSGLTSLVRGLDSLPGQLLIVASAAATMGVAIKALVGAMEALKISVAAAGWVGLLVVALGAAATAWGYYSNREEEALRKQQEEMAKSSAIADQYKRVLNQAKVEAAAGNEAVREALALYSKEGDAALPKINKALKTRIVLSEDVRKQIKELAKENPAYLELLRKEGLLLEDLIRLEKERIALRDARDAGIMNNMNAAVTEATSLQQQLDERGINKRSALDTVTNRNLGPLGKAIVSSNYDRETAEIQKRLDGIKKWLQGQETLIQSEYAINDAGMYYPVRRPKVEQTAAGALPKANSGAAAEEKAENIAERIQKYINDTEREEAKFTAERAKIMLEEAEKQLKTDRDLEEYKTASRLAIEAEFNEKVKAARLKANQDWATAVGGQFKDGEVIAGKDVSAEQLKAAGEATQWSLDAEILALEENRRKEIQKVNATKLPKLESDKLTLSSDKQEKSLDRMLKIQQQQLNLSKETVWTKQQEEEIDRKLLQAEIDINKQKLASYEAELKVLEVGTYYGEKADEAATRYDYLKEKIESINDLLGQQAVQQQKLQEGSFWSNFSEGARQASVSLGSFKSHTTELGSTVINTFSNGIENSLNGMIDALANGENAWKSFRQTIGGMIAEIGQELQKYIVKMLAVWAVQKLIGMASSLSGSGFGSLAASEGLYTEGLATGGYITPWGGIQRFADGGSVAPFSGMVPMDMGVPGKDSVLAMLEPGEIVLKKRAVDLYGKDYFLKHNAMKFAEGGLVGDSFGGNKKEANSSSGEFSLVINNYIDPAHLPTPSGPTILNHIQLDALQNGPTYRILKAKLQGV